MPKIAIVDTYYPEALKAMPLGTGSYRDELLKVLKMQFGTADFYSHHLRRLGHDCIDVIANHFSLQERWAHETLKLETLFMQPDTILNYQILEYRPDVVFLQDLSLIKAASAGLSHFPNAIIAGQCSCPWPGDETVRQFDVIYSSFPHYVKRIEALGVKAVYNPLAFEPSVACNDFRTQHLESRFGPNVITCGVVRKESRIHDCVFIGGVGNPSHWRYGMEVLETVAKAIPTFKWWGYGIGTLPIDSALRRCYQGQAFGLDMYEILLQSKICLNRHGEVAEGFANNMRMYEATGCGALLVTDNKTDLFSVDEIVRYANPHDAVTKVQHYLDFNGERESIAAAGQRRTLRDHTYAKRMKVVSDTLQEMLCPA